MSPVLTIVRRELGATFRAPLAYVFLVLFVVVAQLPVFTLVAGGQAELHLFFQFLPWCIVVFAALVTMRSWAEERQDNTYEMLLTFPMRVRHLVIGKWLSAFAFLALGIAATAATPAVVIALGHPDRGPIIAGYVGALALAGTATAAGVFFSGLTRSQLLAALLSLVCGFVAMLLGAQSIAMLIDPFTHGLGSFIRSTVGVLNHLDAFERGVLEMADVAFFAVWTIVFLHLNTLFIALRRVADSWPRMLAATALGLGCGMLASRLVAEGSIARLDLTEDKQFTLSPAMLDILAEARVPVQVKFYVSPADEMPSQVKPLERDVVDYLKELQVASHGKLQFAVLHLNLENLVVTPEEEAVDEEQDAAVSLSGDAKKPPKDEKKLDEAKKKAAEKAKSIERRLLEKGVKPFSVSNVEATQMSSKLVYATLGVAYREKDEEFISLDPRQHALSEKEYLLANTIARITRPHPPKIALVTGEEPMDPQLRMLYERQGQKIPDPFTQIVELLRQEKYDVEKVKLSAQEPMPEDYDALLVVGPTSLDERQKWEIGRALHEGRPTLLALQRFTWNYRQERQGIVAQAQESDPGLDELLSANGVGLSKQVLMDANSRGLGIGGMFLNLPMHVFVTHDSMNKESELTRRLGGLLYLWGSSLDLDNAKLSTSDLKRTVLLSSSDRAWLMSPPARGLQRQDIDPDGKDLKPRLLAIMLEGQFKNPQGGKPRPKWTPKMELGPDGRPIPAMPDKPETPATAAKGKLIVAGCARMWQDGFLGTSQIGNGAFLLNCIDALTLNENLLQVRAKQPTDRSFEKPSSTTAILWTLAVLLLVPIAVITVGGVIWWARFRRRERWNQSHGRWQS